MPNKFIGLSMRIGGAILCVMLLNKFPVGNIYECIIACLFHLGVCFFATIVDHSDDYKYNHKFIVIVFRILSVGIGCIPCIISMTLGYLICTTIMFLTSLLFVCISVNMD